MTYRNPAIQRAPDVALSILKPTRSLSCVFFQVVLLAVLVFCPVAGAGGGEDPADNTVTVVNEFYYPDSPGHAMNEVCVDIMRESIKEHAEDPTKSKINVLPWSGLEISGAVGRAPRLMALAGDIAADLLFTYWHETRTNIDEGYLMPLNEYIGEDEDGNGWIDDDEAIWPFWKHINPYSKRVATVDGKVYALPYPRTVYQCLIVRADLFQAAGLDPGKPPETWDEFFRMCQKLTYPGKKIPGAEFQRR